MKKINHKIKSLSIELDKSIQLKDLNNVIKKFKKDTIKKVSGENPFKILKNLNLS